MESTEHDWGTGGLFVGPGFLLLAVWFVFGPETVELPTDAPVPIDRASIGTEPPRTVLRDLSTIHLEGFDRSCTDCHQEFDGEVPRDSGNLQHPNIQLRHGALDGCYGCHDRANCGRLTATHGTVSLHEAGLLCARCHGSVRRDWERGIHGRTNGYWDASQGLVRRLECCECHDPHNPRKPVMEPVRPLPGPRTSRPAQAR